MLGHGGPRAAHLYRFPDSTPPRKDGNGELTERGVLAAEADAVVFYSTMHMARLQAERRSLLRVTEDYG